MTRFNRTLSRTAPKNTKRAQRQKRAMFLETLEGRQLLAVDFTALSYATPVNQPAFDTNMVSGTTEPIVTINETDPGNIAITNQSNLRVTTDAGGTFTAALNFSTFLPGGSSTNGDTDTAFDSQGRLFWTNLVDPGPGRNVGIAQMNATTGAFIGPLNNTPNPGANGDDKQMLAADNDPFGISPFADNLYVSWQRFLPGSEWTVFGSVSTDQGTTWTNTAALSNFAAEGFTWPSDIEVAPNGDVYLAYHSQPDINDNELEGGAPTNPNGTSGQVFILRSTDGGLTYGQKVLAFDPGEADITFNRQDAPAGNIPGLAAWTVGAAQPWVLPDATRNGNVYVVTSDDPDNVHGLGDEADVVFSRSTDHGLTWTNSTIPDGAAGALQLFPTAAIDDFGNTVVAWLDNRRGLTNGAGTFLLDVYATYSADGGLTWAPAFMVSDPSNPLDPDVGVSQRFAGPPQTTRIGEYFGIDVFGGTAYVIYNRNNSAGAGSTEAYLDSFAIAGSLTVTGDDTGAVVNDSIIIRQILNNPGSVEVLVNGQRQYAGLIDGVAGGIHVAGLAGNDTLTVDYSNGDPTPVGGIHFDGGGQAGDNLVIVGNGNNHGVYRPDSLTTGDGTVTVDGEVISFENLQPITVSGFFEFTVETPNSVDVLTVDSPAAGQNRVSGTSGNIAIEAVTFFDIVHFEIDTATNDGPLPALGSDSVNFTADLVATLLTSMTVTTGNGNDAVNATTVLTTPLTLVGGAGADVLVGGRGADRIDGGTGSDIISGGRGFDVLTGGDDGDQFDWNQGDGDDNLSGGDGIDFLTFTGADAGTIATENFALSPVFATTPGLGALALLSRTEGGIEITMDGVESIVLITNSGASNITVNDLSRTDIRDFSIAVDQGLGADNITVQGTAVNDTLIVHQVVTGVGPFLRVSGLPYEINIAGADVADVDRLTVNGNDGDDNIKANAGVETLIAITLNGDAGNDTLSADAIINGGAGNDILFGGAGLDTISGNDGDDEIHVDFDGFTDIISGGNGYDRIVITGTPGNDIISAFQFNATTLISTLQSPPAAVVSDTDTIGTVEQVDILAGSGNDTIFVQHAEALEDAAVNGVVFFVDGGAGFTGDRLIVQDNLTGDLLLYRKADSGTEGSITVGPTNAEPLLTDFTNIEYVNPVAAAGGTVVVFKYDPYEFNNDRFNATTLGVGETLNADPVIDPGAVAGLPANFPGPVPQDEDWYRVQALYTGTLDVRLIFRHLATAPVNLPGNGDLDLQVTDAAGNVIDSDVDTTDNARVRIAAVQGEIYFLRVFGKAAGALNTYDVSVANEAAPVPFDLELDDALFTGSDTGRSRFDNVTFDTTPTIFVRVADHALLFDGPDNGAAPPAAAFDNVAGELFDIPFQASTATNAPGTGFRVAIFDTENNTHDPVPLGYATQVVGRPGVYTFTFNTPLAEGSHFLSARVEIIDGATAEQAQGFGDFANLSLEIIVDTTAPLAFFGLGPVVPGVDGLHPDSDSGYDSQILTLTDRYTNDLTPTLWGEAEANANIFVFVDVDNDGVITGVDRFIGQTVAIPEDGGDQNPFGHWELTSVVSMDDPQLVADLQANGVIAAGQINGPRRFLLAAEDLAGNFLDPADDMNIFIDTQGPQVEAVTVAGTPGYDLFDPKPSTDGPTPAVFALNIDFVDQPIRQNGDPIAIGINSGLNLQLALANGNYKLVGDHVGVVNIDAIGVVDFTMVNTLGQTTVQLSFFNALPDDRYTLTISDRIGDDAGNALDGNTNTVEPQENPLLFPSGDGNPGGDFVARFTVDSRPEIGVWATGSVWVDTNGNSEFDPKNTDFTNRDIVYQTGLVTDDVFAGNFAEAALGVADGFDKLAAYGKVGANFRFSVDTDNNGVGDVVGSSATNPNGAPVSGNFNGFAGDGDEVGVWTGTSWFFDTDHDFIVGDAGNFVLPSALRGYGFTGDFDGDGFVDLATFKDDFFSFDLSSVGATVNALLPGLNGAVDRSFRFGQVGTRERPVAADMNLDGFDDIGLYQPDRTGVSPKEGSEWYWLVSGNGGSVLDRVVFDPIIGAPVVNFTPTPFGNDIYQFFGEEFSDPIVGNFDPPVTPLTASSLNTFGRPYDLDLNGTIDIKDLMYVVYGFNLNESSQYARYADLDRNGTVNIADLLEMVFAYNEELAAKAAANGEGATATNVADDGDEYAAAVDDVLADENLFDEPMFALSGDSLGNRKRT